MRVAAFVELYDMDEQGLKAGFMHPACDYCPFTGL
jgi:hypothetical protein